MKYHIVMSDKDGQIFELTYEIYEHRVAYEWARLSAKALAVGARPAGTSLNFQVSPKDLTQTLERMNTHIVTIQNEGLIDMAIPRLTVGNLSQEYLNQLHESFHRYEEEVEGHNVFKRAHFIPAQRPMLRYHSQKLNLYTPTHFALGHLNTLIHWVENAYKMLKGTHINQFFNYYLHPNEFSPLTDNDYSLCRISFNFGDLMLGYGTTGKNLYHCYIDDDKEVVRNGLVRVQETISTEILALFPLRDATENFEQEQNERFRIWCEEAQVSKYGHDINAPQNRIGHIPLGKLITNLDLQKTKEIFGRYTQIDRCYFTD